MVLPIEVARELAITAARSEWLELNGEGDVCLPDKFTREFPWGWIFESALVDGDSHSYPGICVSVDRFSGKTQVIAGSGIVQDDRPLLELSLTELGNNEGAVYQVVRELTGWNEADIIHRLRELPIVIAVGPMTSIRSINEALRARGASTSIARRRA